MKGIKQVKQKTVVFQVMEQLKEMISRNDLKPGDKVPNEYELAEMFGVGRSSIREAMKIFQYLGVIELRNPKGTFVCESSHISSEALLWSMLLGKKDLKELLEMRVVLEHQGLWYLMEYHKNDKTFMQKTLDKLMEEINHLSHAIKTGNDQERLDADYDFHRHIIEVCGNDLFNNLYGTMRSFSYEEIYQSHNNIEDKQSIITDHTKLREVILSGDYHKAMDLFRNHIKTGDPIFQKE